MTRRVLFALRVLLGLPLPMVLHCPNCKAAALRADGGITKLYHELLYAVANKHPGETRHQTAMRYILNAERGSNQAQASPSGGKNE